MPLESQEDRVDIRRLESGDDLASFQCTDADLRGFLVDDAVRLEAQGVTRVYVAASGATVLAYIAVLADVVVLKSSEKKKLTLAHDDPKGVPALKIGRLATHTAHQGRGLGTTLCRHAFQKAMEVRQHAACRLLTVDAYDTAVTFYEKLGFVRNKSPENNDEICSECGQKTEPADGSSPRETTVSMRFDMQAPTLPGWVYGR